MGLLNTIGSLTRTYLCSRYFPQQVLIASVPILGVGGYSATRQIMDRPAMVAADQDPNPELYKTLLVSTIPAGMTAASIYRLRQIKQEENK